jgi:hypothetical protein
MNIYTKMHYKNKHSISDLSISAPYIGPGKGKIYVRLDDEDTRREKRGSKRAWAITPYIRFVLTPEEARQFAHELIYQAEKSEDIPHEEDFYFDSKRVLWRVQSTTKSAVELTAWSTGERQARRADSSRTVSREDLRHKYRRG